MSFVGLIVNNSGELSVFAKGRPYVVSKSHPNYAQLCQAVKDGDVDRFVSMFDVEKSFQTFVAGADATGKCKVVDGTVYYNGQAVHNGITGRILDLMRQGFPFDGMLKFLENLMSNPSARSVAQLYDFLEHKNLPITDDGCFLAYKTVRNDWYDKYSGTILNTIGSTIEVPRNQVDDDPHSHCSFGLHVGAWSYAGPGGWYNSSHDRVIVVKVNPADAVAVPGDHSFTKLRVCKYQVLEECKGLLNNASYTASGSVYDENVNSAPVDDIDFFEELTIGVEDIEIGDVLRFDYVDDAGHSSIRRVEVDDYDEDHIYTVLVKGDPSFIDNGKSQYRTFVKDRISNLKAEENDTSSDDEDDWGL